MNTVRDPRRVDLARIHLLKAQIGMTREQYEAVLWLAAQVDSSADADETGRQAIIRQLESRLTPAQRAQPRKTPRAAPAGKAKPRQRPAEDKARQVAKIRALLINHPGGRRADAYADAMSQKMFGVDLYTWCTSDQLGKLIAALVIDTRRSAQAGPGKP